MINTEIGFWETTIGKIIRWIVFIPIGILLAFLLEFLLIIGTIWLFDGDLRMFLIIGIFFGAGAMVVPLAVMMYYGIIVMAAGKICPSNRVGSIVFGTIYYLYFIPVLIKSFSLDGGAGVVVPSVLIHIMFLITAGTALYAVYNDDCDIG